MIINYKYAQVDFKEQTQEIFALRKQGDLHHAFNLANDLIAKAPNDEWVQRALAWVLVDMIKNNFTNKIELFNRLNSLKICKNDEILQKSISYLKTTLGPNFLKFKKAEELKKMGDLNGALNIYKSLFPLPLEHIDSYGWLLYKIVKNSHNINEQKTFLNQYLHLNNTKPSLLHSCILMLAKMIARDNPSFNLFRFLRLWGDKFRNEDFEITYKDGKNFPSLVVGVIGDIVKNKHPFNINELIEIFKDKYLVIESIREAIFWQILIALKNKDYHCMWNEFEKYNITAGFGASVFNSKILDLAQRYMSENEKWRFLPFFKTHGVFLDSDFIEQLDGDYTKSPLASRCLKTIYEIVKSRSNDQESVQYAINLYENILDRLNDIWDYKRYTELLILDSQTDRAAEFYKKILLQKSSEAWAWAELLIAIDNKKSAKVELLKYKTNQNAHGWAIAPNFNEMFNGVKNEPNSDNGVFYEENKTAAEEFLLSQIDPINMMLIDEFQTKDGKQKAKFSDLKKQTIIANKKLIQNLQMHAIYSIWLTYQKNTNRPIILKIKKSDLKLNDLGVVPSSIIAVIDNINEQKCLFHYTASKKSTA